MPPMPSLDGGPPLSAPLRFFVTAAVFGVGAGLVLAWAGPDLFESRWSASALAFTHFITVGFMMQVLLGALQQLLPVLAGAALPHPVRVATVVHTGITLGGLCLIGAFLSGWAALFGVATVCMATGILYFVATAVPALRRVQPPSAVSRGLRFGLLGLTVTVGIGLANAVSLGWPLGLALEQLANVHLGWGFVAWGCAVLAAVSAVAMPMFQHGPALPLGFVRAFGAVAVTVVATWTLSELLDLEPMASVLSSAVVLVATTFAALTLYLQLRKRRTALDTVQRLWCLGMVCALAACALWMLSRLVPAVAAWPRWPLLFGALLLVGGFMSVILGMVYKIVPFLIWMHLHGMGRGRVVAPSLKAVIPEFHLQGQAGLHGCSVALVLAAVWWPAPLARPAGLVLALSCAWLLRNLLAALALYRAHRARVQA